MITAQRAFSKRIGYLVTCVLPADLLSAESDAEDASSLRADASRDGLTFLQVRRQVEEDLYLARVAASPDLVANGNGYTVLLTETQLHLAMAWDARLEWEDHLHTRKRCPQAILALLHTHAAEVRPLTKQAALEALPAFLHDAALTPLETVEVSSDEVRAAFKLVARDEDSGAVQERRNLQFFMQQALFQAMIDRLMEQLYQSQEQAHALLLKARCSLLAQLQRWHRAAGWGRIVNAAPHYSTERHQLLWRLTVGLPVVAV